MFTLGSGTLVAAPWVSACNPAAIATTYPTPLTIGEVGGDVTIDISWQEKEFNGQSNFPLAWGFYGGKCTIKASKIALYPDNISALTSMVKSSAGGNDVYTGLATSIPVPLFLKFVHTRSDVAAKFVNVYFFKVFSKQLSLPFTREDIVQNELVFDCMADYSMTAKDLLRVESTQ